MESEQKGKRDSNHIAEPRLDQFFIVFQTEHFRFRDKANAERDFERKTRAAARYDVDGQFCMPPRFKLILRNVKIAPGDLAQPDVARADDKLALLKTHRRRPVAASAALVKHQLTVFGAKLLYDLCGFVSNFYSQDILHRPIANVRNLTLIQVSHDLCELSLLEIEINITVTVSVSQRIEPFFGR